jgi:DNA uptake protein ComE-like DNA-binding protein
LNVALPKVDVLKAVEELKADVLRADLLNGAVNSAVVVLSRLVRAARSVAPTPPSPWRSLQDRIRNDPYYRFQSLTEIRLAAAQGVMIDINTATVDDWLRLPGISIHQAKLLTGLTQAGVQFYCIEDIAAALGISLQRLTPIGPILQFCYYDPESLDNLARVNPNTAPVDSLIQLPGVGPVLARAIVRDRTSRGDYRNLVDFQQRLSLPAERLADLLHYLKF